MYDKVKLMDDGAIEAAKREFMAKAYGWMFAGLLLTGVTAWYVFASDFYWTIVSNNLLFFGCIIAEVGLVFYLSSRIDSLSRAAATALFVFYAALNGVTMSVIFAAYEIPVVENVFYLAAAMFAGMSAIGYFTKKDLSGMRSFLYMGAMGLVFALILNWIIDFKALNFAISLIGVLLFSALTAYDTQKLKNMYALQAEGDDIAAKGAIMGALTLYLDFINLFLFLLRLLGGRR